MNNTQKILLIIGISLFIIVLDICLCKCIDRLVNDTILELESLKQSLANETFEESKTKTENLDKKWNQYEQKLSFFVEHDELEKVTAKMVIIAENTVNKQYKIALEDVVEAKYLLEHVKDKNKLKLENIF